MVKRAFIAMLIIASALAGSSAQDKPAEKKDPPAVLMAAPLCAVPGTLTKLTLRGLKLDTATEVTIADLDSPPKVEVKKKEKAAPPNGLNAKEVGDTVVEIEFTLPDGVSAGEVSLTVTTSDGSSQPYALLVLAAAQTQQESEPNEAFRKPNKLALGQTIVGSIHQPRDVDVFEIDGEAGQTISGETLAARRGSALDPLLLLYDSSGQLLAQSDDQAEHRDAFLKYRLPATGKYYLTLIDALDRGSAGHPYVLQLRTE